MIMQALGTQRSPLLENFGFAKNIGDTQVLPKQAQNENRNSLEEVMYLIALSRIDKLGPVKSRMLVSRYGSAKALYGLSDREIRQINGLSFEHQRAISQKSTLTIAKKEIEFAEKNQIDIISIHSEKYPDLLREIHDHPLVIFQKGRLNFQMQPTIAIVGTRKPSAIGEATTRFFSEAFASSGFNVVSGLAFGIDAIAHTSALHANGLTTAVLGHGLGQIYPRQHRSLAKEILDHRGSLITEYCSDIGPDAFNFPSRNRLISGLSHATLVIEAQEKGGALITAKMAFDQNRFVYAIPGGINQTSSVGCNHLIRDQIAKLVLHPEEIVEDLAAVLSINKNILFEKKHTHSAPKGISIEGQQIEYLGEAAKLRSSILETYAEKGSLDPRAAVNQLLNCQLR
jgi:DNA processing protein